MELGDAPDYQLRIRGERREITVPVDSIDYGLVRFEGETRAVLTVEARVQHCTGLRSVELVDDVDRVVGTRAVDAFDVPDTTLFTIAIPLEPTAVALETVVRLAARDRRDAAAFARECRNDSETTTALNYELLATLGYQRWEVEHDELGEVDALLLHPAIDDPKRTRWRVAFERDEHGDIAGISSGPDFDERERAEIRAHRRALDDLEANLNAVCREDIVRRRKQLDALAAKVR